MLIHQVSGKLLILEKILKLKKFLLVKDVIRMLANPLSSGRLNLVAKMPILDKIMGGVFTNAPCLDTLSAGEFIR